MSNYEKIRAKRIKAQAKGLRGMTAEQREAVKAAQDAIGSFISEWTESFDIYDPDTPRKLQSSFWKLRNAFDIEG